MRIVAHPLLERDLIDIATHVFLISQDAAAARRRIAEARELLAKIAENPALGAWVDTGVPGWRVRHGGRGRLLSVVYRHDPEADLLMLAMVAFAGQDWTTQARLRRRDVNAD